MLCGEPFTQGWVYVLLTVGQRLLRSYTCQRMQVVQFISFRHVMCVCIFSLDSFMTFFLFLLLLFFVPRYMRMLGCTIYSIWDSELAMGA